MKKPILCLSFFIAISNMQAQNVGIGISTPSSKLTIASTSSTTEPTLGLFDFSSNGGPRLYLSNAGGSVSWRIFSAIDNGVPFNSTFKIGYGSETSPLLTLRGDGNVGINQPSPAYRLDVSGDASFNGALRMNGNPGTAGQVLTSNGASNPSWQTLPQNPALGFSAWLSSSVAVSSGVTTNLVSYSEDFDDGNNFNSATGEFTAPSAGLYHFDVRITFTLPSSGVTNFILRVIKNGSIFTGNQSTLKSAANDDITTVSLSSNVKLAANDIIQVQVIPFTATTVNLIGSNATSSSVFSGYKVY